MFSPSFLPISPKAAIPTFVRRLWFRDDLLSFFSVPAFDDNDSPPPKDLRISSNGFREVFFSCKRSLLCPRPFPPVCSVMDVIRSESPSQTHPFARPATLNFPQLARHPSFFRSTACYLFHVHYFFPLRNDPPLVTFPFQLEQSSVSFPSLDFTTVVFHKGKLALSPKFAVLRNALPPIRKVPFHRSGTPDRTARLSAFSIT